MNKIFLTVMFLMGLAGAARAERRELTSDMIREKRREAEELLLSRIDRINADFAQTQGFEAKLKDERLNFERQMIDERRAFLEELLRMDKEARWSAWENFRKTQDARRRTFHEGQIEQRRKFRELRDEWRSEFSEEVRERQRRRAEDAKDPSGRGTPEGRPPKK